MGAVFAHVEVRPPFLARLQQFLMLAWIEAHQRLHADAERAHLRDKPREIGGRGFYHVAEGACADLLGDGWRERIRAPALRGSLRQESVFVGAVPARRAAANLPKRAVAVRRRREVPELVERDVLVALVGIVDQLDPATVRQIGVGVLLGTHIVVETEARVDRLDFRARARREGLGVPLRRRRTRHVFGLQAVAVRMPGVRFSSCSPTMTCSLASPVFAWGARAVHVSPPSALYWKL